VTEVTENQLAKRNDFEMMEKICIGKSLQRQADSRQVGTRQAASASGFTLVELMVAVAIMAILLTIAFPDLKGAVQSYQLTSKANSIASLLNHARSESAKRGLRVTICSSTNGTSCAGDRNWEQGWIMFVDADNTCTVTAGDSVIQTSAAATSSTSVATTGFTITLSGAPQVNYLSFVSSGMPKTSSFSWWNGNITVRRVGDSVSDPGRQVTVSRAGSIRVSTI